jgi:hypothetical protein
MRKKKPRGLLQNLITYICFKAAPLSESKLTKLVYLVDVYHYENFGKRLTRVPFKHYYYGAWAPDISGELEKLSDANIIKEEIVQTRKGTTASVPKPAVRQTTIHLPETGLEALSKVLEQWGSSPTDDVVSFTKTTLPFANTPFGERIDFRRCDPVYAYASDKRISKRKAAMLGVASTPFLAQKAMQGDEELRSGEPLLTREAVFGR